MKPTKFLNLLICLSLILSNSYASLISPKLNLAANTLTFENSSNTEYSKGTNLNVGLNFALPNAKESPNQDKEIKYREYPVEQIEEGRLNDVHRIVVGSDGTYYYSNTHYGNSIERNGSGIPFYRAGKLPQDTIDKIFGGME